MRIALIILMGLIAATPQAIGQATAPATAPAAGPAGGEVAALIVVGAPGTPMYQRHYRDRAGRFAAVLQGAGVAAGRITRLGDGDKPATAQDVLAAVRQVAERLRPADGFVLILLGHGANADGSPTLMLDGPDLRFKDLAAELGKLKCRSQVVLNFSAAAGDALPLLSLPGRVNIAGSSPGQVNDNDFAEFFLQELEGKPMPDLLTAFNRASQRFGQWIVRQKRAVDEGASGWIVEGRESAALFRKLYDGPDVPEERRPADSPESQEPDAADPPLVAEPTEAWRGRRVITESPALDDAGKGSPVSALGPKGYAPVAPTKESPNGSIAAKTMLGRGK